MSNERPNSPTESEMAHANDAAARDMDGQAEDALPGDDLISMDGTIPTGDGDPRDERIAELEQQLAETKDQALRAMAEAENVRRRTQRENEQIKKYAAGGLAKDLMSALDNLARALQAAPDKEGLDEVTKNLVIGVEMIEKEVVSAFEKNHIQRVDPMGEKFDPNFHEAMFEVPDSGKPAGTVVQVLAPGYVLRDRLLRAAMVGVAKGGAPEAHKPIDTTA
jgi:molecular chaperone GrpE